MSRVLREDEVVVVDEGGDVGEGLSNQPINDPDD